MATRTTDRPTTRTNPPDGDGRVHDPAMRPQRRVRLPELAVGVLVTVGFALAAVLWHLSATERVAVLAVASPIERGAVVTSADVRVVYVSAGDEIARSAVTDASAIIGSVAALDLPVGVLWSSAFVTTGRVTGAGEGLVGVALEPGQYPPGLIAGNTVNVVVSATGVADEGVAGDGVVERAVVRDAEVVTVDGTDGRVVVALRTSLADAELVASLTGSTGLRLVLVGE